MQLLLVGVVLLVDELTREQQENDAIVRTSQSYTLQPASGLEQDKTRISHLKCGRKFGQSS